MLLDCHNMVSPQQHSSLKNCPSHGSLQKVGLLIPKIAPSSHHDFRREHWQSNGKDFRSRGIDNARDFTLCSIVFPGFGMSYLIFRMRGSALSHEPQFRVRSIQAATESGGMAIMRETLQAPKRRQLGIVYAAGCIQG